MAGFQFKQFNITQERTAMKVGTDGVLLGAWANCAQASTILDIGTGTGLVALMLAQRSNAQITAVEIDSEACIDARENFVQSKWSNRIELQNTTIQAFADSCTTQFDLIVCNPPFFSNSLKAPNQNRNLARHDDGLPTCMLFTCADKLLSSNGLLAVVIPHDKLNNYIAEAMKNNLSAQRIMHIKPTPTANYKRALVEFSRNNVAPTETEMVIEDKGRHGYSDIYINLTRNFYLKF